MSTFYSRPRGLGRPRTSFAVLRQLPLVEDWPAIDRLAWDRACSQGGPLDPPGAAIAWAAPTRNVRRKAWARFLSFLRHEGILDPTEPTADRLTRERLGHFILSMRERLKHTTAHVAVADLYSAISAMVPDRNWSWVKQHAARPRGQDVDASRKQVDPPDPAVLARAALSYCDQAEAVSPSRDAAVRFRDGLMVALSVYLALRRKNLAEMEIGQHLRLGETRMRVVFDGSVKNYEVIDVPLPELLDSYVRRYLDRYRPVLMGTDDDTVALWINRDGTKLHYEGLRSLFDRMGRQLIGRPLTCHSVRYALASGVMRHDPKDLGIAAAALAHRGRSSVNLAYDRSGAAASHDVWRGVLKHRLGATRTES